jgi:hypothetical protein
MGKTISYKLNDDETPLLNKEIDQFKESPELLSFIAK